MRGKRLPPDTVDALRELLAAGVMQKVIAWRLGVHRNTVSNYAREVR